MNQYETLKDEIIHNLDILEFLDILGLELADLVEILEDEIEEHAAELQEAVR